LVLSFGGSKRKNIKSEVEVIIIDVPEKTFRRGLSGECKKVFF
jgi:hypothetical protein